MASEPCWPPGLGPRPGPGRIATASISCECALYSHIMCDSHVHHVWQPCTSCVTAMYCVHVSLYGHIMPCVHVHHILSHYPTCTLQPPPRYSHSHPHAHATGIHLSPNHPQHQRVIPHQPAPHPPPTISTRSSTKVLFHTSTSRDCCCPCTLTRSSSRLKKKERGSRQSTTSGLFFSTNSYRMCSLPCLTTPPPLANWMNSPP